MWGVFVCEGDRETDRDTERERETRSWSHRLSAYPMPKPVLGPSRSSSTTLLPSTCLSYYRTSRGVCVWWSAPPAAPSIRHPCCSALAWEVAPTDCTTVPCPLAGVRRVRALPLVQVASWQRLQGPLLWDPSPHRGSGGIVPQPLVPTALGTVRMPAVTISLGTVRMPAVTISKTIISTVFP